MMDIYTVNVGENFTHSLITHISSSDWIRASKKQFSRGKKDEVTEVGKKKDKFFVVRVSGQV